MRVLIISITLLFLLNGCSSKEDYKRMTKDTIF